jgi:hypothetical protein
MLLGALLAAVLAQAQSDRMMSGAVVDDHGKPVAGARVVLYATPLVSRSHRDLDSGRLVGMSQRADAARRTGASQSAIGV